MITVTHYKLISKNALVGIFSIKVEKWGGLIIEDMCHFKKGSHQWVNFPSRTYEDNHGEKKYFHYAKFDDLEVMKLFQSKVIIAIENYLNQHPELLQINDKIEKFENPHAKIPF